MGYVITYKDGLTITEREQNDWTKVSKDNITSLSIKDVNGILHTLSIPSTCYGVFQHKVRHARVGGDNSFTDSQIDNLIQKSINYEQLRPSTEIGFVYAPNGDCVVINIKDKNGQSKVRCDNVVDMGMNLTLHGINLGGHNDN